MGLKLEEFYKMSVEEAISKLELVDVRVHTNGRDVVAIELKYENKDINQAPPCADESNKKRGETSTW